MATVLDVLMQEAAGMVATPGTHSRDEHNIVKQLQTSKAEGCDLASRLLQSSNMLRPAAAIEGTETKGAIFAPTPSEHSAMNGESCIVALPASHLHNAQGC